MNQPRNPENYPRRRDFLRWLAGAGATIALAACGGPNVTPTPTRTPRPALPDPELPTAGLPVGEAAPTSRLALPYISGPPGTPAAPLSPLADPPPATLVPSATPAPPPTLTLTPAPTPFPPGPPTKLGLFITRNDSRIRGMLQTGNVAIVKTLEYDPNFALELKGYAPGALLIGRIDLPQPNLDGMNDPEGAAQAFVDRLLPIATEPRRLASFDAWEAYNEPAAQTPEQMGRLAAFEARRTELLAAHGVRSVVGNFSTGNPDLALWPYFRPALEAVLANRGYLGLHEYSAPTMQQGTDQAPANWGVDDADEGWLTLRYRKAYRSYLLPNNLPVPLLLTEIGIDGTIAGQPGPRGKGWKDFAGYWSQIGMGSSGAGAYVQQLAWYDANLQLDAYVLGAAIFSAAASPGWESYEILDEVEPILRQYLSVHPPH